MKASPDFCPDLDDVLRHLNLGDRNGLAFHHRAQDLQSFPMTRAAVNLLRADPTLVVEVEGRLSHWSKRKDSGSLALMERWSAIVASRDWDAAVASTEAAQQLRQASPLSGLLPHETRLAIIRYVRDLRRS